MKLMNMKNAALAALMTTAAVASHAAIDVADAVTEIQSNSAGVNAVGVAIISVVALVFGIRLIKGLVRG